MGIVKVNKIDCGERPELFALTHSAVYRMTEKSGFDNETVSAGG